MYSIKRNEDFPDGLVVKTPSSQCREHGFKPWSAKIPHALWCGPLPPHTKKE